MKKLTIIFALFISYMSYSQSISLFDIDTTNFPIMKAKFYAFDANGNQITNLSPSDIELKENGLPRTLTNVSCPIPKPPLALSSVLVFDVSGSMSIGPPRIKSAKDAANAWVDGLPLGKSECALISFSNNSMILSDFTTNRQKLKNSIDNLVPTGGTNYNQALIDLPCGGLQIANIGKHKRVLIFLTDGQPNFEPKTSEIIQFANSNNITIYAVTLDIPAPQSIKDMTLQTGGLYFENITTLKEAQETYQKLLQAAQGGEPCEITWESGVSCFTSNTNVELKLPQDGTTATAIYKSQNISIAKLEFNPAYLTFKNPTLGVKEEKKVIVTARNADLNVTNIVLNNNLYTVNPSNFTLKKNESKELTISYTAAEKGYTFCKLEFQTDLCPFTYFITGGYIGEPSSQKTLEITKPIAGDLYVVGSDTIITWKGIAESDTVSLEYSIDNGANWKLITNTANGLKYNWKNIPKPATSNCIIRARQRENSNGQVEPGTLQFNLSGHTSSVYYISWSPDGSKVATASSDNTGIIWDANTGTKLHTLRGHTACVPHISWSSDGSRVATASWDNTGIIWDAITGTKLQTLTGHEGYVNLISWSPDGNRVATVSRDSRCIIWDANTGKFLTKIGGFYNAVNHISWSPDGGKFASADDDGNGIIWDAKTGNKLHTLTLKGHGSVYHIDWSPDGSKVATASYGTGIIWDANTGAKLHTLSGHTNFVWQINWSPDGSRVATASSDSTAIIWDANNGTIQHTLIGHTNSVNQINWSPDGSRVTTVSYEKIAIIWNANTGTILHTLSEHKYVVNHISWSPNGSKVATASWDKTGIIWDAITGTKLYTLNGHFDKVTLISWNPKGDKVATASGDKTGIIWDANIGAKLHTLLGHTERVNHISWSPDGNKIATTSDEGNGIIWDAINGAKLHSLNGHLDSVNYISWSPDGSRVATASSDSTGIIWDANTGTILHILRWHTNYVINISWSPDGSKIATASWDNTAIIWDANTGTKLHTLTGHYSRVNHLSWSPDGSRVATVSPNMCIICDANTGAILHILNGTAYFISWSPDGSRVATAGRFNRTGTIWDAFTGEKLNTLSGHTNDVVQISWSPDGSRLATASYDKTGIIWDAISGTKLHTLSGHTNVVNYISWNPNGSRVATASWDSTAKIWIVDGSSVIQEDESDIFSIVEPTPTSFDIDFQKCLVNNSKDSLFPNFVFNSGTLKFRVDSIYFSGTDANAFKLVSGLPKYELNEKEGKNTEFNFQPKEPRKYEADIIIVTQSKKITQKIRGEGIDNSLEVYANWLDFGKVPLKYSKVISDTILIKNISSNTIKIDSITNIGPDKTQFEILDNSTSFILQANEEKKLKIRFKPIQIGRTTSQLAFHYNHFSSPSIVRLFGEGIDINPKLSTNSPICEGDRIMLFADTIIGALYYWSGPNNFNSVEQNPIIKNANQSHIGKYSVFTKYGEYLSDTSSIDVFVNIFEVSPGDSSFIYVGSANKIDNYISLTNTYTYDGGSVWLKNKFSIKNNFSTSFKFRTRNGNDNKDIDGSIPGADGFALVFQNHNFPTLGVKGGSIGYSGISNSIALEIDLYKNEWDQNGNHIAIQSMKSEGNQPDHRIIGSCLGIQNSMIEIKHDQFYYCRVDYNWNIKEMKIYIDSTGKFEDATLVINDIDLTEYLQLENDEHVFIGITSATGNSFQNHDISDWTIPCKNILLGIDNEIEILPLQNEMKIYPNPSSDMLHVFYSLNNFSDVKISIFNSLGIEILGEIILPSQIPGNHRYQLMIDTLPQGLYYVVLKTATEQLKEILIKLN